MNFSVSPKYKFLLALFFLLLTASSQAKGQNLPAQIVGKVLYTNGLVTLAGKNTPLQIIAEEQAIYTGDRIATGLNSKAIIKLLDGSQISLIENTEFLVSRFSIEPSKEHAELQLFRGGIRSVSGFINKFNNNQFKLLTPIGSVVIRGTDFTAFICTDSCAGNKESDSSIDSQLIKINNSLVKGRLVMKTGVVKAREPSGQVRKLYVSSPLYAGDIISSENNAMMVAVFRDDTRVTLNQNSIFQLGNYQYLPNKTAENYAGFKLLRGSIRFLSGDIAKHNPDNYILSTPQHRIRVNSGGIDLVYAQSTHIAVWQGMVNFVFPTDSVDMTLGDKYLIDPKSSKPRAIQVFPAEYQISQRPDSVVIEQIIKTKKLFAVSETEGKEGLYLYVKNGEIEAQKGSLSLNLGSEEVGFLGNDLVYRLNQLPTFLIKQFIDPRVDQKTLNRLNLMPDLNIADPDGPICEI